MTLGVTGGSTKTKEGKGEVSGDCIVAFRAMSKDLTGSDTALFQGELEHLLAGRPSRFYWDELLLLYARMERTARGRYTLEECGERIFDMPALGGLFKIASVVTSPSTLYTLGNTFGLNRTFNHLEVTQRERDGRIEITIRIPDQYADSTRFFTLTKGVLQAFPRMLGLPDALVELELSPRFGRYLVTPPPSTTIWARIARTFRAFFMGRRALDELNEQQTKLNTQFHQLQAAYTEVSDALETKRRFLSVMSHELRTPLNGIVGSAAALRHEDDDDAKDELLSALDTSAGSLARMVAGVLDFARFDQEAPQLNVRDFEIAALVESTVTAHRDRAASLGLGFEVSIGPELPARIATDSERLGQIIDHLLDNATKFTREGSVSLTLTADEHEGRSAVRVKVTDTGIGIAPKDQERIFGLFTQLDDSSTRGYGGTGLGLTLCDRLATVLGASITVDSAPNEGSTFAVVVPYEAAAAIAPVPEAPSLPSQRVLVVDDNRINRMVLSRMVQKLGFEVDQAEDGSRAVECVREHEYLVVFMDIEMPVMNGLVATQTIRESGYDLPIVATTAYVSDEDRGACRDVGMNDFLSKPVTPKEIESGLLRWVHRPAA